MWYSVCVLVIGALVKIQIGNFVEPVGSVELLLDFNKSLDTTHVHWFELLWHRLDDSPFNLWHLPHTFHQNTTVNSARMQPIHCRDDNNSWSTRWLNLNGNHTSDKTSASSQWLSCLVWLGLYIDWLHCRVYATSYQSILDISPHLVLLYSHNPSDRSPIPLIHSVSFSSCRVPLLNPYSQETMSSSCRVTRTPQRNVDQVTCLLVWTGSLHQSVVVWMHASILLRTLIFQTSEVRQDHITQRTRYLFSHCKDRCMGFVIRLDSSQAHADLV